MSDFEQFPLGLNPYENDPGVRGSSLLTVGEIVLECLDAVGARSVAECGAYAGDFTRLLLAWAERSDGTVLAIDPAPQPELERLAAEHPGLELRRETSLAALEVIPLPDVVFLDGDHNYYTVSEELRRIFARAAHEGSHPVVVLHDVCWPHARRDDYHDPERIPAEYVQPLIPGGGLYPGVEGVREGGLAYRWAAAREGGPRNGVLTAVEDAIAGGEDHQLAVIPAFFGLGILWQRSAPYAAALARVLEPWDRNPVVARLEGNRVLHLASELVQTRRAEMAEEQLARHQALLERMLHSRVFGAAETYLRVRQRGNPPFSKAQIRRLLGRERGRQ